MKKQADRKNMKEITGGIFSDTKFLVQSENIIQPPKIPDRFKNLKIPLPIKSNKDTNQYEKIKKEKG